jgi:hypothetical protein
LDLLASDPAGLFRAPVGRIAGMTSRDLYIMRGTIGGVIGIHCIISSATWIITGTTPLGMNLMFMFLCVATALVWWAESRQRFAESVDRLTDRHKQPDP